MEKAAVTRFFSASSYAVVGSFDPAKFGYKVLTFYLSHSLPVTPIHSSLSSIAIPSFLSPNPSSSVPTVPSLSSLPSPSTTSLSIITPPAVTLRLLAKAKAVGIHSVFLQPGTYDDEVMAVLEGDRYWSGRWVGKGNDGRRGPGGWCVLVDGEDGLSWAREERQGKGEGKGKL
ncbi:CoA binding domain-containing protein [Mrakia frigida]|uniref:CoA-binding protein n=1 Tax=Mrakia frigida TaxID=29902 RepID=UPI003FCC09C0